VTTTAPTPEAALACACTRPRQPSDQAAGVVSAHQVGSADVRVRGAVSLRLAGCRTGKQEHRGRRDCAQPHASLARSEHCAMVNLAYRWLFDRGQGARPFSVFGGRATIGRPCGQTRGVAASTTSAVASHSIGPRAGAYRQVESSNCAGKRSRSRRCPGSCRSRRGHRP
jgi:hypothetical protein